MHRMCSQKNRNQYFFSLIALCGLLLAGGSALAGNKTDDPVDLQVTVQPAEIHPGATVEVTVRMIPNSGYKINRYPMISLKVPAIDGTVAAAETRVGNKTPPPLDKQGKNYFKTVDPIVLPMNLDKDAGKGDLTIPAKLKYYYCVASSGYCSMMREEVAIPVTVQ